MSVVTIDTKFGPASGRRVALALSVPSTLWAMLTGGPRLHVKARGVAR